MYFTLRVHVIYYYGNFWVYPVLEFLGPVYRTIFFLLSILILVGFYKLGQFVNETIWGEKATSKPAAKKSAAKKAK